MKHVLLAVDFDDTLCDTQSEVILRLRRYLYDKGMFEDLKWIYESVGKVSTMLYPPHLRTIINEHIIKPGHYVTTVKPTKLITDNLLYELLHDLKWNVKERRVKVVGCTHRGTENNVNAETHHWLREHKADAVLDDVHFVDSKVHKNKIELLTELYPEYKILLLDDNPFGDLQTEHPYNPAVLIYEELYQYEAYKHQNKFTSVADLKQRIFNLLCSD